MCWIVAVAEEGGVWEAAGGGSGDIVVEVESTGPTGPETSSGGMEVPGTPAREQIAHKIKLKITAQFLESRTI